MGYEGGFWESCRGREYNVTSCGAAISVSQTLDPFNARMPISISVRLFYTSEKKRTGFMKKVKSQGTRPYCPSREKSTNPHDTSADWPE